jgi:hypothetical protein
MLVLTRGKAVCTLLLAAKDIVVDSADASTSAADTMIFIVEPSQVFWQNLKLKRRGDVLNLRYAQRVGEVSRLLSRGYCKKRAVQLQRGEEQLLNLVTGRRHSGSRLPCRPVQLKIAIRFTGQQNAKKPSVENSRWQVACFALAKLETQTYMALHVCTDLPDINNTGVRRFMA